MTARTDGGLSAGRFTRSWVLDLPAAGVGVRVLVTGGAGFIGSHLVDGLLSAGHRVRVLDNLATGRSENLAGALAGIEWIEGSSADPETAARAVTDIDVILHQAAIPSVARSLADPVGSHTANVTGTITLLTATVAAGVRRFVYAGSSSAYGDSPQLPKIETMPANPRSPYAVSKLAGELYCRVYAELFPIETVCLRYFNVFGPRQDPTSRYAAVIPRFIQMLAARQPVPLEGDGTTSPRLHLCRQRRRRKSEGDDRGGGLRTGDQRGVWEPVHVDGADCRARDHPRSHAHHPADGASPRRRPALARRHRQGARAARLRAEGLLSRGTPANGGRALFPGLRRRRTSLTSRRREMQECGRDRRNGRWCRPGRQLPENAAGERANGCRARRSARERLAAGYRFELNAGWAESECRLPLAAGELGV